MESWIDFDLGVWFFVSMGVDFGPEMASSDAKIFLFDEVANHNKTKDCWLIIAGKVADLPFFFFLAFTTAH